LAARPEEQTASRWWPRPSERGGGVPL